MGETGVGTIVYFYCVVGTAAAAGDTATLSATSLYFEALISGFYFLWETKWVVFPSE